MDERETRERTNDLIDDLRARVEECERVMERLESKLETLERENLALRGQLAQADSLHVDTLKAWGKQVYSPN